MPRALSSLPDFRINRPDDPQGEVLREKTYLFALLTVSIAFAWILLPFYGVVFWATVLAIVFAPVNRRLCERLSRNETLAALLTLATILVVVILPLAIVGSLLVREAMAVYERVQSGDIDYAGDFEQMFRALPPWITGMLDDYGVGSLEEARSRLSAGIKQAAQFVASHALAFGQNAFNFVMSFFLMLYVLFFLLRDGTALSQRIRTAVPLDEDLKRRLFANFARVIRATIKGSVVVAVLQGALGRLMFWLLGIHAAVLWAVLMAFRSLLPAIGTALVWSPVAVYFLLTGTAWKGLVLIAFGVLVIGLVDNVVRPILVGKDTRMPDYLVLMSTLGGLAVFGINGFVIGPVIAALFIAIWSTVPGHSDPSTDRAPQTDRNTSTGARTGTDGAV